MKSAIKCAILAAALLGAGAVHKTADAKADPNKVLRVAFEAADDGFDLARTNSLYSTWLAEAVFEPLLTYDYLARPVKLVPRTAESMPEISGDGLTYTFRIKKGRYFTPHPAFKGQKRELVAADYVYTIKRHLDPAARSVQENTFRGKIVGLDELAAEAKASGKFDYDKPIAGLETPDRHTLRIRLKTQDYTLLYNLASAFSGALAREVVEMYGEDVGRHPVGTGPYMLKDYVARSKIVFEANPDYPTFTWDFKPSGEAWDEDLIRDMKGKQMPQIGRVEVSIMEEEQARWLGFDSGQIDLDMLALPAAPRVLDNGQLKPQFVQRGIKLYRFVEPGVRRTYFNMKDPVVGGYTKERIALRRALAMAYNYQDEINQVWYGQAVKATSHLPPSILGYDKNYRTSVQHDPVLAAKLLDHFGYTKGPDGWRTQPDGKPLVIKIHSAPHSRDKAKMEIWKKSLDKLGVRAEFPVSSFADNLKAAYRCELSMWGLGGTAANPDGIDFLENYYGPKAYTGNLGCYQSKAFDEAYEAAEKLPPGPERYAQYIKMQQIMEADTVQLLELWRIRNWVSHPWVKGFKKHPILSADWMYLDIDKR